MNDELTRIERQSIRAFVQSAADAGYLSGRVIDFGAGRMPYRDIVENAGGVYEPFDRADFPANDSGKDIGMLSDGPEGKFCDSLLCNQVVQYVPIDDLADEFFSFLHWMIRGHLILTYPTNWPEVNEGEDLWRFTRWGMERLLIDAGFAIVKHEQRWSFEMHGYEWAAGYGVVARA